jgi:hypothetical protein
MVIAANEKRVNISTFEMRFFMEENSPVIFDLMKWVG